MNNIKNKLYRIMVITSSLFLLLNTLVYSMQIFVRLHINNSIVTLDVESSDSIENVKQKIYNKSGTSPAAQYLYFNTSILEDGRTLADYSITTESWLDLYEAPLPVELISFKASISGNDIELEWQTATEVNNYGFEVERLQDGKIKKLQDWETLGFVEGHGNSNSPKDYTFMDTSTPLSANSVNYRLKQLDIDGGFDYSPEVEVNLAEPTEFKLAQNYPNPFNPSTTITYGLKSASDVQLTVYNLLGQEVITLVNKHQTAGNYQVLFDASNLTSGTYFYKIAADNFVSVKKLLLLK